MDYNNIIRTFNSNIKQYNKGFLVLHRKKCNTKVNAYIDYKWKLWLINGDTKRELFLISKIFRETNDKEKDSNTNVMEVNLLNELLAFINTFYKNYGDNK